MKNFLYSSKKRGLRATRVLSGDSFHFSFCADGFSGAGFGAGGTLYWNPRWSLSFRAGERSMANFQNLFGIVFRF